LQVYIKTICIILSRLFTFVDIFRQQGGIATRVEGHEILNEITLHRTEHPLATTIHCAVNGHSLATVVGDGLIVATATGSTAYLPLSLFLILFIYID
jgi:NAD kinase